MPYLKNQIRHYTSDDSAGILGGMDSALNPYSPGAGLRPVALVGRDAELQLMHDMVVRAERGLHNRGMILHGLRGVGKTVLLNEMAEIADTAEWFVVRLEARGGDTGRAQVRTKLAREMVVSARKITLRKKWRRIREALPTISSFSLSLGFSGASLNVDSAAGRADSGDIGIDLEELVFDVAEAAAGDGKALAFFIDEMQDLDPDLLAAVISAQHLAGQRGLPFFVIGAGLPTLPSVLAGSQSYSERLFSYHRIGRLSDPEAEKALREPARQGGADFDDAALTHLLRTSGNYPYFLQEYGKAIWDVAPTTPFTADDAALATEAGTAALDDGFFPSRWDRATPAEKRFLAAMANHGQDMVPVGAVARGMDVEVRSLGTARKNLIEKGLVYSPAHGQVQFTVPGMSDFIRRTV